MSTRVFAVCAHKGGVGKTTLAVNLADVLARTGLRVLLIDADPQANATASVGLGEDRPPFTLYDVLANGRRGILEDAVHKAGDGWWGIEVVASNLNLEGRQADQAVGREARLRTTLEGVEHLWDAVIIDCPSNLGLLTINALTAATDALLVTAPEVNAVEGLADTIDTCAKVRSYYNQGLRVAGIVVNRYLDNRRDGAYWVGALQESYPELLLAPFISEREAVRRAASAARPLSYYDRDEGAAHVHGQLAELAKTIMEESR
jgi:chromosome partitioning protein